LVYLRESVRPTSYVKSQAVSKQQAEVFNQTTEHRLDAPELPDSSSKKPSSALPAEVSSSEVTPRDAVISRS